MLNHFMQTRALVAAIGTINCHQQQEHTCNLFFCFGTCSVANMFLIPLGMALGADVSVKQFLLGNLLPVTLGNIFAGAICMVSHVVL